MVINGPGFLGHFISADDPAIDAIDDILRPMENPGTPRGVVQIATGKIAGLNWPNEAHNLRVADWTGFEVKVS